MRRGVIVLGLLLAACGSSSKEPVGPPQDQTLNRHEQAGRAAYELDRPAEAVLQFAEALKQAEARDDLTAIAELSFNLAVAQLRANQAEAALATTTRARAELTRRGQTPFAALLLAEATALYRTGDKNQADALAGEIETASDRDTAAGASFLRGLIADEMGNDAGLQAARQQLAAATTPVRVADRLELDARLALRGGSPAAARQAAQQAAGIRQEILDYRGMARALAVAGLAAKQTGDNAAASDFYLRAGRSAAAQGDGSTARPWLEETLALSQDPAVTDAAQRALDSLDVSAQ